MQTRRQQEQRRSSLIWGGIALLVIGLVAVLVWNNIRPASGQELPIQGADHIPTGEDPGEYSTNPPTSGPHYSAPLEAGFYDEADLPDLGPYPQGHLVHNLEHGYIVIWYNCDLLSESACEELKEQLRDYIEGSLVRKLIAFPWEGTDVPLVLTSWGFMLEMPEFSARQASNFINSNRLRAPEPNAP